MERIISGLEGVRLCVQDNHGAYRKVARIDWNNRDASLYITSYCPNSGAAFAGRFNMPKDAHSFPIDVTNEKGVPGAMPKLSLHEKRPFED